MKRIIDYKDDDDDHDNNSNDNDSSTFRYLCTIKKEWKKQCLIMKKYCTIPFFQLTTVPIGFFRLALKFYHFQERTD